MILKKKEGGEGGRRSSPVARCRSIKMHIVVLRGRAWALVWVSEMKTTVPAYCLKEVIVTRRWVSVRQCVAMYYIWVLLLYIHTARTSSVIVLEIGLLSSFSYPSPLFPTALTFPPLCLHASI